MTAAHQHSATADADEPSALTRVRRKPDRARYDTAAVHAVLDAAPFVHVATVRHGRPVVLPMAHGRRDGALFLHGSRVAGLFRDASDGSPVCVTATLFDGLVLGRSARNHSMNYRSVTIHGPARPVTEPEQIIAGLRALVDHVTPGRWDQVRKPTPAELRETALWQVAIDNASVKARTGSTLDPDADRALQVWAGHVPAWLTFGQPIEAEGVPPGTELPGYLRALPRCQLAVSRRNPPRKSQPASPRDMARVLAGVVQARAVSGSLGLSWCWRPAATRDHEHVPARNRAPAVLP